MSTGTTRRMTADEFWEWASRPENEDRLYELDEGEVVEVPPPGELHGVYCAWVVHLLWDYVLKQGAGRVCSNDTGLLVRRDPDTVRGPDIMLFAESRPAEKLARKYTEELPRLVVEVLSPKDQMSKVNRRISQYLRHGVPLVWLVDADLRVVTVYQPGKDLYTLEEGDDLTGEGSLPDLRIPLARLFALPGEPKDD